MGNEKKRLQGMRKVNERHRQANKQIMDKPHYNYQSSHAANKGFGSTRQTDNQSHLNFGKNRRSSLPGNPDNNANCGINTSRHSRTNLQHFPAANR